MLMDILQSKKTRGSEQGEFNRYWNNQMTLSGKVKLVLNLEEWV